MWRVDPDRRGQRGWLWRFPDETFRVRGISHVKRLLTEIADVFGAPGVDHLWGHQAEAGMMVLRVVPGEEDLAETTSIRQ